MSTTASATATYAVTGMTCGCCVNKVRDKVGAIPGVTDVAVDLDGGTVTVAADAPIGRDEVAAAVGRAGFQLAD
ncbi:Copper chaperone CopZ [Nocardia amikacinitolerans]|uniref:Copper chaperone CopZ n=1 Tax=Nocardia amikacinitolerans TaxID=756689 RepID=A0A285LQJ6_9NOCA|nr:heavy metal-associated domain-containing protein [Nocardia amikacinitolerans]MCP2276844.1 Copper chaperone CopZ [Nocardia amikacinitolerans]SNY87204.1 Copper chaperone CopZ [Nocardia amikacinitolerans]